MTSRRLRDAVQTIRAELKAIETRLQGSVISSLPESAVISREALQQQLNALAGRVHHIERYLAAKGGATPLPDSLNADMVCEFCGQDGRHGHFCLPDPERVSGDGGSASTSRRV